MQTHVVDFEEILKNFTPYHDSLKSIQKDKQEFSNTIDGIKKEMETILSSSKSLILDDATNRKNQDRFRELQTNAVQVESEFRAHIVAKQNDELENNFNQVIEIVNDWSKQNSIDLVVNKSSVVYVNPKFEITNDIVEIIKQKGLYQEFKEGMYEVEVN
jgi:Skp family chaperone for outer membrane proteins